MAQLPNYPYKKSPTAQQRAADKRFTQQWLKVLQGQINIARQAAKKAKN